MKRLAARSGDGVLLRRLAVAHTLVGFAFYRGELRSIGRDGVLAGVPYRGPKATAFWFLIPSPLVWIIGRLVSDAEETEDWSAVRTAHRVSLVSAAAAIFCMPVSGFWGWLCDLGAGSPASASACPFPVDRAPLGSPVPVLKANDVLKLRRRDLDDLGILHGFERMYDPRLSAPRLPWSKLSGSQLVSRIALGDDHPARQDV
jgi:Family of unknown function (DUF6463)